MGTSKSAIRVLCWGNFGGKSCPVNFARIPDRGCHMLAAMGGVAASHCVDDVLAADRTSTIVSGFLLWRHLAALAGWDVPDRKSPPPTNRGRILGAESDLTGTPSHPPVLRIAEDRAHQLSAMLQNVLDRDALCPGRAGKIFGRLGFATTGVWTDWPCSTPRILAPSA